MSSGFGRKSRNKTASQVAIITIDADGLVTLAEGAGLAAFGLVGGNLLGRSVFDLMVATPQVEADYRRALAGETLTSLVETSGRLFEAWYAPLRDPVGRVTGAMGISSLVLDSPQMEGFKVLVVDDDLDMRNMITALLAHAYGKSDSGEELDIRVAANGVDALQTLSTFTPDLTILDLMMPIMDGMTLLKAMRQDPRYLHSTIAVVTARKSTAAELGRLSRDADLIYAKGERLEQDLIEALTTARARQTGRRAGRALESDYSSEKLLETSIFPAPSMRVR